MTHKLAILISAFGLSLVSLCEPTQFHHIKLKSEINLNTITNIGNYIEVDGENGLMKFKQPGLSNETISQINFNKNNMVFHHIDGQIEFITNTNVDWQTYSPYINRIVKNNPYELSDIMSNGKSIQTIINTYGGNPIYGKKIAVIGDSEINGAYETSRETTYPNYIVERNNMMMFQTCCSKLAMPRYTNQNPVDGITYRSLIGNYRDIIPGDVDIIWIHNGYNDKFDADTPNDELLSESELNMTDEQCRTKNLSEPNLGRSYKKSFNSLMVGLTNNYPNAKIAISLPYNFDGNKTAQNNFIKERCKVYGIEYIDGSFECDFTTDDKLYFTIRADGTLKDRVHLSLYGSERISWTFEQFMKTRMQISPRKIPQKIYDQDDVENITTK